MGGWKKTLSTPSSNWMHEFDHESNSSPKESPKHIPKMKFGKYKNSTISEMCEKDSKYSIWLLAQPWLKDELKNEILSNADRIIINFGIHTGRSLQYIIDNKQSYYEYLTKPKEQKENV
jgi:hypothetical protein